MSTNERQSAAPDRADYRRISHLLQRTPPSVHGDRSVFALAGILALSLALGCDKPTWRGYDPSGSASASASAAAASSPVDKEHAAPSDPVLPLHRRTYSIVVDGDFVHAGTTAGVVSWDFTDRMKPKRLASLVLQGSVQRVTKLPAPSTLLAVATGPTGVALVDVGSVKEAKLTLVNQHPWSTEARGGCHAAWGLAPGATGVGFLACGGAGVARMDLSDPTNAAITARVSVDGYVRDVAVLDEEAGLPKAAASAKRVAAAAGLGGLAIVDFGGIKPKSLTQVDLGGEARALAVKDGHAYVAAGAAGLVIVDVRKPTSPAVVGRLLPKTTDMARGVSMFESYALLCLGDSGLAVVDVSNPASPREVGRFDPEPALNRVAVSGQQLFAANDADGVAILDISKPDNPTQVYPPPTEASD
jgi:LVIVD repeat